MTKTVLRFLLAPGLALALSSCDVFRPDDPNANANTPNYGAADAYGTNNNNNAGGYQPYQQPGGNNAYGATNTPPGGYTQPNYNTPNYNTPNYNATPYTQPPDNPYSTTGGGTSASGRTHVVAGGENLSKIAQRYGTTTDAIMRANNITNPNYVRAGQKLTIP